nr:hypothetical protein GCM10020241_02910 [Streptoalloteichus tenebrarius]
MLLKAKTGAAWPTGTVGRGRGVDSRFWRWSRTGTLAALVTGVLGTAEAPCAPTSAPPARRTVF